MFTPLVQLEKMTDVRNNNHGDERDAHGAVVRRIASYLSLEDAESMVSSSGRSPFCPTAPAHATTHSTDTGAPPPSSIPQGADEEDWFVGGQYHCDIDAGVSSSEERPPNLAELSPSFDGAERCEWTPAGQATGESEVDVPCHCPDPTQQQNGRHRHVSPTSCDDRRRQEKRSLLQQQLAAAVFAHPEPLRRYSAHAYATALDLGRGRREEQQLRRSFTEADGAHGRARHKEGLEDGLHSLGRGLLRSVPLSVLLDVADALGGLAAEVLPAAGRLGLASLAAGVAALCDVALRAWGALGALARRANPLRALRLVPVSAGAGSVSHAALHRLGVGFRGARRNAPVGNNPLESKVSLGRVAPVELLEARSLPLLN